MSRSDDIAAIKQKINRINRRKPPTGENIRNIELMQNIYEAPVPDVAVDDININFLQSNPPPPQPTTMQKLFPDVENELPLYMREFSMFLPRDAIAEKPSAAAACSACDAADGQEGFSLDDVSAAFSGGTGLNLPIAENNQLYQFIFYLPNSIKYIVTSFSLSFTKVLTELDLENTETEDQILSDAQIVEKIIYYIISFPLAVFVMYNWFFVIVYRDHDLYLRDHCEVQEVANNVYGNPTCRPANDNQRMKITFDGYKSKDFLEFFLFFIIIPFKLFDTFILGDKWLPQLMCYVPWKILCKFISLLIAFLIVFWIGLFDTFVYIVSGNTTLISWANSLIIFGYFVYYVVRDIWDNEAPSLSLDAMKTKKPPPSPVAAAAAATLDTEDIINAGTEILAKSIHRNYSHSAYGFFSKIIKYTVRFIVAVFSIPISSVLLNMYIWFVSFFGILFFGGGMENFAENFNKMETFVESDIYKLFDKNKTDCVKPSILMLILKSITKFIYRNFYTFIMLFLIGVNMFDTIMNMNSVIVKYMIVGLLSSPALFLLLGILGGGGDVGGDE